MTRREMHDGADDGGVVDLETLPLVLKIDEVARIYRLSASTVRRQLLAGTFFPRPWDRYPYRWNREDIAADLKRPRHLRPAPHGGRRASRQAKAALSASQVAAARAVR